MTLLSTKISLFELIIHCLFARKIGIDVLFGCTQNLSYLNYLTTALASISDPRGATSMSLWGTLCVWSSAKLKLVANWRYLLTSNTWSMSTYLKAHFPKKLIFQLWFLHYIHRLLLWIQFYNLNNLKTILEILFHNQPELPFLYN